MVHLIFGKFVSCHVPNGLPRHEALFDILAVGKPMIGSYGQGGHGKLANLFATGSIFGLIGWMTVNEKNSHRF